MEAFGDRHSMEQILHGVFYHLGSKGQETPSLLLKQGARKCLTNPDLYLILAEKLPTLGISTI